MDIGNFILILSVTTACIAFIFVICLKSKSFKEFSIEFSKWFKITLKSKSESNDKKNNIST